MYFLMVCLIKIVEIVKLPRFMLPQFCANLHFPICFYHNSAKNSWDSGTKKKTSKIHNNTTIDKTNNNNVVINVQNMQTFAASTRIAATRSLWSETMHHNACTSFTKKIQDELKPLEISQLKKGGFFFFGEGCCQGASILTTLNYLKIGSGREKKAFVRLLYLSAKHIS